MATWAIGDIHGCWRTLARLLELMAYDRRVDRLWLVGDLVNRGPRSLEVLRWAADQGDRLTAVLGNHDLHLLARAAGVARRKRSEQLDEVLEAPERDDLVAWLRRRPLVHRDGDVVLVHAGLLPQWSASEALAVGDEMSSALAGDAWVETLAAVAEGRARRWSDALDGPDRLRTMASAFTRLRTVRADGRMCLDFTGEPASAPEGCVPWFTLSSVPGPACTVVFGHWASLGCWRREGLVCLDSGCVYGGRLSALRLEDGLLLQEARRESAI